MKFATFPLLILVFILSPTLFAQLDSNIQHYLGVKKGAGFIIAHEPSMEYFTQQHIGATELFYERQIHHSNSWLSNFNFPRIGISFHYFNFQNRVVGHGFSVSPYLNFKLYQHRCFEIRLKPTIGFGYLSRKFHVEENPKNAAIGSHGNIYFSVPIELELNITKRLKLLFGSSFSHFSNTSYRTPNLGINIPTLNAGVHYQFKQSSLTKKLADFSNVQNPQLMLLLSAGLNENYPPNEQKYFAGYLGLEKRLPISVKHSFGLLTDFFYNQAHLHYEQTNQSTNKSGIENLQIGLSLKYVIHFGRINGSFQNGMYVKNSNKDLNNFYQIVGGEYHFTNNTSLLLAFKTHLATAEFISIGFTKRLSQ